MIVVAPYILGIWRNSLGLAMPRDEADRKKQHMPRAFRRQHEWDKRAFLQYVDAEFSLISTVLRTPK